MMHGYEVHRTPEQGHTRRCLAKALIAAVENLRDTDAMTDLDFRVQVQEGVPLQWADMYLNEGITECLCPRVEHYTDGSVDRTATPAEPVLWGDLKWRMVAPRHYETKDTETESQFRATVKWLPEYRSWESTTYTWGMVLESRQHRKLLHAKAHAESTFRSVTGVTR